MSSYLNNPCCAPPWTFRREGREGREGREACQKGKPLGANPYISRSHAWCCWDDGWLEEYQKYRLEQIREARTIAAEKTKAAHCEVAARLAALKIDPYWLRDYLARLPERP